MTWSSVTCLHPLLFPSGSHCPYCTRHILIVGLLSCFTLNCLKYSSPSIVSFSFKFLLQNHPLNVVNPVCVYICLCVCARVRQVTSVVSNFVRSHERQAPLSMGFSRQEYWSGFLCPPPGDLPNPGIEPVSLKSPALAERVVYL